jgi:exosortase/archaeosortase family protein
MTGVVLGLPQGLAMTTHAPPEPAASGLTRSSRFVVVFALLAGTGLALYFFPYEQVGLRSEGFFDAYLSCYARVTGTVLRAVDPAVGVTGSTITGRFAMRIVRSCDAMEANILFVSAALAFPAAALRKAQAVVVGLAALVGCNVARLCCLYFVGVYAPARFDFAHYEAWPLAMVAFATVDFFLCARWMTAEGPASGAGDTGAPA